jgi:hypothetical protein
MLEKTNVFFNAILKGDTLKMHMSRRLGIVVFCMVPAIIGGGILYGIFGSYVPVAIFEIILGVFAIGFFSK